MGAVCPADIAGLLNPLDKQNGTAFGVASASSLPVQNTMKGLFFTKGT